MVALRRAIGKNTYGHKEGSPDTTYWSTSTELVLPIDVLLSKGAAEVGRGSRVQSRRELG